MQSLQVVDPYVRPSVKLSRPYRGFPIGRRRKVKVYRGGQPVRDREIVLAMVGRKV
jgi:hypothetical protein